MQLLGKLLGDPNKRDIRAITPLVDAIEALEPTMQELSDEELSAKTVEFRSQLALYLKGGMVLENELVKLFREALDEVEPLAKDISDEQLHAAMSGYRQRLEHRRDAEYYLKSHLQDTLSECFEQSYEQLSPTLNTLRVQRAMQILEEKQQWPEDSGNVQRATLAILQRVVPEIRDIDEEEQATAFKT